MNGEWNMKSLIRKGYEILDERAIFRYHKDKEKIYLENPYWKMCMWVWDNPRLPINVPLCQEIIEATNEPHTGKNFFATTQLYTPDGYVKPHQDRGTFSVITGKGRKLQILDDDSGEWFDAEHVLLLGTYGAQKLGGHAPFHKVEQSNGFSFTLQVGPDNLPFMWKLPDAESTDSYRYGSELDKRSSEGTSMGNN